MSACYPTSFATGSHFAPQVLNPDDVQRRVWYCQQYDMEFDTLEDAAHWFREYCHYERDSDVETTVQDVLMTDGDHILAEYGQPVSMCYMQYLPCDQDVIGRA